MNLESKKCILEKIHADVVLSVGVNCRTAHHLGCYNLRKEANPLDWVGRYKLKAAYNSFAKDFKDFFLNVKILKEFGVAYFDVMDLTNEISSIHLFLKNKDIQEQSKEINSQAIRRWLRLKKKIINAKDIVFVYNGTDNIEEIITFLKSVNKLFGLEKNYYFVQVKHDRDKKWNEIEFHQYEIAKNLKFYQYIGNDINITDNKLHDWHGNDFLWAEAMKNISLRENELPKEIIKFKGAVQVVKNHLSYKLGEAAIYNSKSFFGYIRMPFILYCVALVHKEKIKAQKNNLSLTLNEYSDYKEALKIKECFTYKLGQIIINASNNIMGGGYIKMWFKIRRLKKEFKIGNFNKK
ncbi:TPA: hypothetical protein RZK24_000595 [Campylobacter coli]|nr:hypothetical protein [Campylobacter coli]HEB9317863.1 hypothetical protein [Campylobacter coli]